MNAMTYIQNVMLAHCHDAIALNTLDALGEHLACEDRIRSEPFPVTSTSGDATERASNRLLYS